MKRSFGAVLKDVIEKSDIVLFVLDARFISNTRNFDIEHKILEKNKTLIHVINKCDLVHKSILIKKKSSLINCIFISATKYHGLRMLYKKIQSLPIKNKNKKQIISVIGYPNVGKSSIINALSGRHGAKTSSIAGFTKGIQLINLKSSYQLLDTPGIIERYKKDINELVLIGAKSIDQIDDHEFAVEMLFKNYHKNLIAHYATKTILNFDNWLIEIANNMNFKKKGDLPDTLRAAKKILVDWQSGKIHQTNKINSQNIKK